MESRLSTSDANYFRLRARLVLDKSDRPVAYFDGAMSYSTAQAANVLKISRQTLHRWIVDGKVAPPRKQKVGGVTVRFWTKKDVERVRRYKKTFYGKGPKPKRKAKR